MILYAVQQVQYSIVVVLSSFHSLLLPRDYSLARLHIAVLAVVRCMAEWLGVCHCVETAIVAIECEQVRPIARLLGAISQLASLVGPP